MKVRELLLQAGINDSFLDTLTHIDNWPNQPRSSTKKLYNSLGHGCDEEAIRVIKLLEFEVPKSRGLRLTFHKEIHIHFRMPKTTTPIIKKTATEANTGSQNLDLQYNIAKPKATDKPDDDNNNGYNYTVSI